MRAAWNSEKTSYESNSRLDFWKLPLIHPTQPLTAVVRIEARTPQVSRVIYAQWDLCGACGSTKNTAWNCS